VAALTSEALLDLSDALLDFTATPDLNAWLDQHPRTEGLMRHPTPPDPTPARPTPIRDLPTLLATLDPQLQPGVFVFTSVPHGSPITTTAGVASIREPEGVSLILPEAEAQRDALPILARCAWITLTVASDLHAVGLTAAVAAALRDAGLSCNIVAGAYHDHLFVPVDTAPQALTALHTLQAQARAELPPPATA
jgi:hypothetical protein